MTGMTKEGKGDFRKSVSKRDRFPYIIMWKNGAKYVICNNYLLFLCFLSIKTL